MSQISGFWTTSGSPTGHQVSGYTQSHWSTALAVTAACARKECVGSTYRSELAGSVQGANTYRIAPGGAIVDGKWYDSDANEDITIPSTTSGERIDRIVVRATWASYQAVLYRIAGTESGSPTPPALTQNPGSVYDLPLYQVRVDNAGTVTTEEDERPHYYDDYTLDVDPTDETLRIANGGVGWTQLASIIQAQLVTNGNSHDHAGGDGAQIPSGGLANNSVASTKIIDGAVIAGKIGAGGVSATNQLANAIVTLAKLAADSVDDTKVGNRVPKITKRVGGSATDWDTPGSTTYTVADVLAQIGSAQWTGAAASSGYVDITFPTAYSNKPLVIPWARTDDIAVAALVYTTYVRLQWYNVHGANDTTVHLGWLAIGEG